MDFIINNIFLVAIAAISGAMLLYPMLRSGTGGPRVDKDPAVAKALAVLGKMDGGRP